MLGARLGTLDLGEGCEGGTALAPVPADTAARGCIHRQTDKSWKRTGADEARWTGAQTVS
jgi:hypothetical protein